MSSTSGFPRSRRVASPGGSLNQQSTYSPVFIICILLLSNLLVYQLSEYRSLNKFNEAMIVPATEITTVSTRTQSALDIPTGAAIALPSIRVQKEVLQEKRGEYGGAGDKPHLGGFTDFDGQGVSPDSWKWMVSFLGVKSVLDIGCGRGISTSWFALHGLDVICVEGSHDAYENSLLPSKETRMVEHDFSRGPWWPPRTVDAVWCVEFLEHVGRNFHHNYLPAFRKAALIFVTSSRWGGWHHVEVHEDQWWIAKFQLYGFQYSNQLTQMIKEVASREYSEKKTAPDGDIFNAQHVWLSMKVFINPMVAALPEHAHLFAGHGCFDFRKDNVIYNRECNTGEGLGLESPLPKSFYPLELTSEQDKAWEDLVRKNVMSKEERDKLIQQRAAERAQRNKQQRS